MISFIDEFFNIAVNVCIVIVSVFGLLSSLFLFNFLFIVRRSIKNDEVEKEDNGGSPPGKTVDVEN